MKKFIHFLSIFILISCQGSDLFDNCGCKKEWFIKLEQNEIQNSTYKELSDLFPFEPPIGYEKVPLTKLVFKNKTAEKFLSSFDGAEKYYIPKIDKGIVFLTIDGDLIRFYAHSGEGFSLGYAQSFSWEFKNDELIITSPYDENFKLGRIVNINGKAKFIPEEAFLIEKGFSKDKLPSKVTDFCACKCEYKNRRFSDQTASDSCEIFLKDTREKPNWELFGGTKFY